MATVNKDFRVKHGLVVQGTNATVNASDIITEDAITGGTQTNITVTYNPTTKVVDFVAENGVADSTTDNLTEGSTNKYFTDERAQDAIGNAVGTGLTYNDTSGAISVTTNTYDAYGSASAVAGDLTTHTSATEAHGATGAVVGTTNTQTLTNKTLTSPKINEDVVLTATATELNVLDGIGASTAELNTLIGITATASELNILDGVTSTASELNILDGATLTTTELNYVDGVTSAIQTQLDGKLDESGGTMTGNIAMGTNKITGLGAPTDSTDAATKAYVDATAEGLHVKPAVLAATTADLGATYNNGTNGVDATLTIPATATLNIDGQTAWEVGDGILVKDQDDAFENGRYYVVTVGNAGTAWVLKRCIACDEADEIPSAYVFVQAGSTYVATGWVALVENPETFTVGQDDITWEQFSGAGTYLAGNGLNLDGNTFSIDDTITATKTYVDETFVTLDDLPGELDDYVPLTQRAAIDGVATLDGAAQVPLTQLENVTDVIDALTTADIAEDSGSLYFTNARAVTALEAVVPDFTAIEVNSIAKQVAAIAYAPTASSGIVAYAFPKADYRSAKFLVKVAYSTHTEVSEVLLTLDSSDNIAITEFAMVSTNGSASLVSANVSGSNVQLLVTPTNNSSTVTVFGTLLSEDLLLS
jgi:hypothetical protein